VPAPRARARLRGGVHMQLVPCPERVRRSRHCPVTIVKYAYPDTNSDPTAMADIASSV